MRLILYLVFCLTVLTACPRKSIVESKPFLNSYLITTCEFGYKRHYLMVTRYEQDLDSIILKNQTGRKMKLFDIDLEPDSCPIYSDMERVNMMIPTRIKGNDYTYIFGGHGMLLYQNPYCSKQEDLADMDSFPYKFVIFDIEIDTLTAELNIWRTVDSIGWRRDTTPWRKIQLNDICSKEEMEEQKKSIQSLYEKYTKIEINPNPFVETFSFKMVANFMAYSFVGKTIKLKFMDESGQVYLERTIEEGKQYEFSLPDYPKGKIVFYTITWDDYKLSGQLMKSQ